MGKSSIFLLLLSTFHQDSTTGACSRRIKTFFLKLYTLRSLLRPFLVTNTTLSVLPVCLLHVHMKVIAHANNWSLTLAFHIILTQAPVNFMVAQAWVCPGVAMPMSIYIVWLVFEGSIPTCACLC